MPKPRRIQTLPHEHAAHSQNPLAMLCNREQWILHTPTTHAPSPTALCQSGSCLCWWELSQTEARIKEKGVLGCPDTSTTCSVQEFLNKHLCRTAQKYIPSVPCNARTQLSFSTMDSHKREKPQDRKWQLYILGDR